VPQSFGAFVLHRSLGRGGMAEVFLAARDTEPGRPRFVLKRCRDDVDVDEEILARLKLEAQVAASHDHRNLVDLIEFGKVGDRPYLVMEYVQGISLDRLLAHVFDNDDPPPSSAALAIGIGLLDGLGALHGATERGGEDRPILHRDVKPRNVIIESAGRPVLIDYGIALDVFGPKISTFGKVVGTPRYMAPERRRSAPIDARSDVFSASMILFELLTARHPWAPLSGAEEMLRDHLGPVEMNETADARIPADVRSILLKGLEDDPSARWGDGRAMARALEATASGQEARRVSNPWGHVRAWTNATGLAFDEALVNTQATLLPSPEGEPAELLSIPPLAPKEDGGRGHNLELAALGAVGVLGLVVGWFFASG